MTRQVNLVTLKQVAARANKDPKFFKDVVAKPLSVRATLAKYEMRLSLKEELILKAGIAQIRKVESKFFTSFGGWGRWPTFNFK